MGDKKITERKILRTYYSESDYDIVTNSENPDFILRKISDGAIFGVEVTQYFDTPTSGRFKNIPNYVSRLLSGQFIHKDDVGSLKVIDTIYKIEADGSELPLSAGVLRELPRSSDRIEALKKVVAEKNSKFSLYNKNLDRIDLLIYDSGDLVAGIERQKFEVLSDLYKQEKANTLVSPFKQIVLVINSPESESITILLKTTD